MPKFEEKTIATKKIFQGHIINVQVDDVVLPNGKVGKRELVKHPGAVAIIAITSDDKIVLVEQFRKPLERTIIEIPAGKMEAGELPLHTAKRELEEETGYGAEHWEHVQTFSTSPGFADEIIHIYVAQNLYEVSNRAVMDEDEFVELIEVSLQDAQQLMTNEQIYDAKTVFAIQWCLLHKLTKK
ncbi:ADP-ribose pyrophosphatase [Lysinibacillus alkalisoli]|uniref:ADP-ribose pyrophosphatase n=1 Tax=Lysinibacillus alkalisoli TaxID=1911548 RepID=A0A917G0Y4_9BACI|nr:NUDIX hydrolase [Lysinibacillus alkalisoli]GGG17058.1 ADP-ribose pyrophosphatase [Lysinibacillus alkalisoli]